MQSFCRTCLREVLDNTSPPVDLENNYKHQLMFSMPQLDLRLLSDAKLCNDCVTLLNVTYKFKFRCREVENKATKSLMVKQEISLSNNIRAVCRTCLVDIEDGNFLFATHGSIYRNILMLCAPELNLRTTSNIHLCKDCSKILDMIYSFKFKCVDVEKNVKEYLKSHDVVDRKELSAWCNVFVKNEISNVANFTIKQEEVDLVDEDKLRHIYPHTSREKQVERKRAQESHLKRPKCTETDAKPYKCSHCKYSAKKKSNLRVHIRTHTGQKPFKCSHCEYSAALKFTLQEHIHTHTGEKPYKCPHCKYSAAKKSNLRAHVRLHTDPKPGDRVVAQNSRLQIHVRTCADDKLFRCSWCEYGTTYKSTFKIHVRAHTGEKPFKCSLCEYSAKQKVHLQEHVRTHTGEKPFKCSACGYSSTQKSNLNVHIRTHTGERPFKCSQCNYSTGQKSRLKNHSYTHI